MLRTVHRLLRRARNCQLLGKSFAGIIDERFTRSGAHSPEPVIGNMANAFLQSFGLSQPAVMPTSFFPKIIRLRRLPTWHMNSVGHVSNRHLMPRPLRKQ